MEGGGVHAQFCLPGAGWVLGVWTRASTYRQGRVGHVCPAAAALSAAASAHPTYDEGVERWSREVEANPGLHGEADGGPEARHAAQLRLEGRIDAGMMGKGGGGGHCTMSSCGSALRLWHVERCCWLHAAAAGVAKPAHVKQHATCSMASLAVEGGVGRPLLTQPLVGG